MAWFRRLLGRKTSSFSAAEDSQAVDKPVAAVKKHPIPFEVEAVESYTTKIATSHAWELDLDFKTLKKRLDRLDGDHFSVMKLVGEPVGIQWGLQVFVEKDGLDLQLWRLCQADAPLPFAVVMRVSASCGGLSRGWEELAVSVMGSDGLNNSVDDGKYAIADVAVPASRLNATLKQDLFPKRYRLDVSFLRGEGPEYKRRRELGNIVRTLALPLPPSLTDYAYDVKLCFPQAADTRAVLWSSPSFLTALSPFFEAMLNSGFVEAIAVHSKEQEEEKEMKAPEDGPGSEDDSDDELDKVFFSSPYADTCVLEASPSFRRVKMQGAWSTYRAILAFHETGEIPFAPLRSTLSTQSASSLSQYYLQLGIRLASDAAHPLPVSPKSVYRAANFLLMPHLATLAVHEYCLQLTPNAAVMQLFAPSMLEVYDELRKVTLEYLGRNWMKVKDLEALRDVKEKIRRGDLPGGATALAELMEIAC